MKQLAIFIETKATLLKFFTSAQRKATKMQNKKPNLVWKGKKGRGNPKVKKNCGYKTLDAKNLPER